MKKIFLLTIIVLISLLSLVCYRDDLYDNTSSKTFATLSLIQPFRAIYIFTDPATTYNGNLGGRPGADATCQALYTGTFSFLEKPTTVKAFISVDFGDNIKDLAPGFPTTAAVYGAKAIGTITPIANSWDDLWITATVPLLNNLSTATDANVSWWSGSDPDGLYDTTFTTTNNCSNWTDGAAGDGQTGSRLQIDSRWIRSTTNPRPCSTPRKLLCVAY
jgi:hypothetical protein